MIRSKICILAFVLLLGACTTFVPASPTATPAPTVPTAKMTISAPIEPVHQLGPQSLDEALAALSLVQSAEEETAVFDAIWENAESLGFAAYDVEGNKVNISSGDWDMIHHIQLRVDGQIVDYVLLDPNNLVVLMRE